MMAQGKEITGGEREACDIYTKGETTGKEGRAWREGEREGSMEVLTDAC